jgi:hypothetical protein
MSPVKTGEVFESHGRLANIIAMPAWKAWLSKLGDMARESHGRRVSKSRMAPDMRRCGNRIKRWAIM